VLDTSVFLATIEVEHDPSLRPNELRLELRTQDGPFGELTKRGLAGKTRQGKLLIQIPQGYPTSRDPVEPRYSSCSYVIDCDDEAIGEVASHLPSPAPSPDDLVKLASRHVTRKSLSRGFDIASEVARSGEGDCSEHAVLLAALARRHHRPARVVLGFAVLSFRDRVPLLVGHAWTEIHDGKTWQVADAALFDAGIERLPNIRGLSYLPVSVLGREDLGFRAQLIQEPGVWHVVKAMGSY
jgi:transglutaminase-like putative cysteine protease